MLALAGDFGTTQAALPEPAPFVGSRRCGECHPQNLPRAAAGKPARADASFRRGLEGCSASGRPGSRSGDYEHLAQLLAEERRPDRARDHGSKTASSARSCEYAVGSGRHGITMLAKDEEGIDRELRVSYFGQDQGWGQTKGIDFAPRDGGDHIGIGSGTKDAQSLSLLPHDVVPLGRPRPLERTAARKARPWNRLRAMSRTGAQLTSRRPRSGFAELAIALAREDAVAGAVEVVRGVSRRRRVDSAERPGVHPGPGHDLSVQPLFHRRQGPLRLHDLSRPAPRRRHGRPHTMKRNA